MKIKIKNMYGINRISEGVEFESNLKNNFIYGINASGKSSIAKSLMHLINKEKYQRQLSFDSESYNLLVEFDGNKYTLNEFTSDQELENLNCAENIFVYNKDYAINNINIQTNKTPIVEIGIRQKEKQININEKDVILTNEKDKIIKRASELQLPNTGKEILKKSIFINITSRNNPVAYEKLLNEINKYNQETIDCNIDINCYSGEDFHQNNIKLYQEYLDIINELDEKIIENLQKEKEYKIRDLEEKKFYEMAIVELEKFKENVCPICKSTIDYKKITEKINDSLQAISKNQLLSKLEKIIYNLTNKTELQNKIKVVYENIINGKYDDDNINKTKKYIEYLHNHYDLLYTKKLKIDIITTITNLEKINKTINNINDLNKELKNDIFTKKFDDMLKNIFKDNYIRVSSNYNPSTDAIELEISINGQSIKELAVKEVCNKILSESQKAKISLAFFFATIIYKDREKILCVFDDPMDSYDSNSKYHLSNIISDFMNNNMFFKNYKYDCYNIVLSHSVEYMRLFYSKSIKKSKENSKYWILTNNGFEEIDKSRMFVIEGDYTILEKIIANSNNYSFKEIISTLPIMRELSKYSSDCFNKKGKELEIGKNKLKDFDKEISNNYIHGLIRNNNTINELNIYLSNFFDIKTPIEDNITKMKVKDYYEYVIENSKNQHLDFFETIVLKNIIAMYIRANFDLIVTYIIQKYIMPDKTAAQIHEETGYTIGHKVKKINDNKTKIDNYEKIYSYIIGEVASKLSIFNDFGHSANLYMTPLIDVTIEELYEIYESIKKIKIDNKNINALNVF